MLLLLSSLVGGWGSEGGCMRGTRSLGEVVYGAQERRDAWVSCCVTVYPPCHYLTHFIPFTAPPVRQMGSRAEQLHALVGAVTALDVVAARAGHSAWIGGVRPQVTDPDAGTGTGAASSSSSSGGGGSQGSSCLFIPGARHPVLMQRGLPPLPQPPSVGWGEGLGDGFNDVVSGLTWLAQALLVVSPGTSAT